MGAREQNAVVPRGAAGSPGWCGPRAPRRPSSQPTCVPCWPTPTCSRPRPSAPGRRRRRRGRSRPPPPAPTQRQQLAGLQVEWHAKAVRRPWVGVVRGSHGHIRQRLDLVVGSGRVRFDTIAGERLDILPWRVSLVLDARAGEDDLLVDRLIDVRRQRLDVCDRQTRVRVPHRRYPLSDHEDRPVLLAHQPVQGLLDRRLRLRIQRDPEHLTQEFIKTDREGRILIDTGRNGPGATFAASTTFATAWPPSP